MEIDPDEMLNIWIGFMDGKLLLTVSSPKQFNFGSAELKRFGVTIKVADEKPPLLAGEFEPPNFPDWVKKILVLAQMSTPVRGDTEKGDCFWLTSLPRSCLPT